MNTNQPGRQSRVVYVTKYLSDDNQRKSTKTSNLERVKNKIYLCEKKWKKITKNPPWIL